MYAETPLKHGLLINALKQVSEEVILIVCKSAVGWLRVLDVWVALVKPSESFKYPFSVNVMMSVAKPITGS